MDITVNGTVEDIIFQSLESGYAVFSVSDNEDEVICVGIVPDLHKGESLRVSGNWAVHPVYGKQLSVEIYEKSIPTTAEGIEKYLASGVIKGIGKKMAARIVDKFGETSFYVIEEKPDRLVEIRGITYEKAMRINQVFREQHELRRAMILLQKFGLSPIYALKIYKKYKGKTFDIVNTNPYQLADDIFGIGFKMADKLAISAGILENSPHRVKSGLRYVLNSAASDGNVFLPEEALFDRAKELLEVSEEMLKNALQELQIEHKIWREKINEEKVFVYLNMYYYAEISVAKKILELMIAGEICDDLHVEVSYQDIEKKYDIELAENQLKAVNDAVKNGVFLMTGGPGTGKTTTINTIIKVFEEAGKEVVLAAPTGRAAKRMTEATGQSAQTIHRLLGINYVDEDSVVQVFSKNEDEPIEADVVIIDESSMVDILLMNNLLKAISVGTKLILVGDIDQLPSVGAGNVLKDLIKSDIAPVVKLDKIFRQAQESMIVVNAHRINKGEEPLINEKASDFFFVKRASTVEVVKTIKELVSTRLPSFMDCDAMRDIQVLTPMRKSPIGVLELNKELQQTLNPPSVKKKEKATRAFIFREGDKVMQIKNNYNLVWRIIENGHTVDEDMGIFNGDGGIVLRIDDDKEEMVVIFDENKYVIYDFTQIDELELAYAITIHKSQGSEYPIVVIPVHSGPPMLLTRNLLYTAVTRAKSLVVLVGLSETMNRMIENNKEINRYSSLDVRLRSLYEFINFSG